METTEKNSENSKVTSVFDHHNEEERLLKQKKLLKQISIYALIGSLAVVFIVFFVINLSGNLNTPDETQIAAKVNNNYITIKEVAEWRNFLETQKGNMNLKSTPNEEDVLKQLIAYELLVNEAKKEGIKVSEAELNYLYENYNALAQYSLEKILISQNISASDFYNYLRQTLLIQKLFEKVISSPAISEKDIDNFILENSDFIKKQTMGKNLTQKDVRDSVKLTLIDITKEELKNQYIENLMSSSQITYYNKFSIMN